MASDGKDLFEAAISLLTRKVRKTKGRMKQEEVVNEIELIKFQLDALAKSHLLTSITLFKEGLLSLFKVLDRNERGDYRSKTAQLTADLSAENQKDASQESPTDLSSSFYRGLQDFKLENLDEEGHRALLTAKEDFHQARLKATEAFNNEGLSTLNRIQAIAIRVAAKILENVDHPREALAVCKMSLEDLHSLKRVQESFSGELSKSFRSHFGKEERRQIIASVCQINRAIYDVMSMIGKSGELLSLPLIGEGKDTINPLHDSRVAEVLCKLDVEQFSVQPLTLGQQDGKDNQLKIPQGIAADSQGRIIVGDEWDCNVKVYDRFGKFQYSFPCPPSEEPNTVSSIADVATDDSDNAYILIEVEKSTIAYYQVYVFTKQAVSQCFSLKEEPRKVLRMTLNRENEVLVIADVLDQSCSKSIVAVYNKAGQFMRSFGEQHLKRSQDLTVAGDGRILVLDKDDDCSLTVHVFFPNGKHSFQFNVDKQEGPSNQRSRPSIAFHQALSHVAVAVPCKNSMGTGYCVKITIYALKDDRHESVRSIELAANEQVSTRGITVTFKGHVAVAILDRSEGNSRAIFV